jgi:hypothetical protein
MTKILMLAVIASIAGGCYNYDPLPLSPTPQRGTYVAATLSDSGMVALSSYLGPEAAVVRGQLLGSTDAGLLVAVDGITTRRGQEMTWHGETVTLPLPLIARFQSRHPARGKSAMLIGVGVASVVGAIAGFSLLGGSDRLGQGGGSPHPQ